MIILSKSLCDNEVQSWVHSINIISLPNNKSPLGSFQIVLSRDTSSNNL